MIRVQTERYKGWTWEAAIESSIQHYRARRVKRIVLAHRGNGGPNGWCWHSVPRGEVEREFRARRFMGAAARGDVSS